jgi:hypothetical protein
MKGEDSIPRSGENNTFIQRLDLIAFGATPVDVCGEVDLSRRAVSKVLPRIKEFRLAGGMKRTYASNCALFYLNRIRHRLWYRCANDQGGKHHGKLDQGLRRIHHVSSNEELCVRSRGSGFTTPLKYCTRLAQKTPLDHRLPCSHKCILRILPLAPPGCRVRRHGGLEEIHYGYWGDGPQCYPSAVADFLGSRCQNPRRVDTVWRVPARAVDEGSPIDWRNRRDISNAVTVTRRSSQQLLREALALPLLVDKSEEASTAEDCTVA